ncbi:hypothetical protein CYY_001094 [Polysphondylium violaceum]|uniref:Uncharacterized protein n=1 Tax=Polysphondylium violaceum TaxID=133409 RepID=A0A8J4Q0P3_9MYCE|nr:hypothetical protein CYY_001094 [Polysphondylium violaceum]
MTSFICFSNTAASGTSRTMVSNSRSSSTSSLSSMEGNGHRHHHKKRQQQKTASKCFNCQKDTLCPVVTRELCSKTQEFCSMECYGLQVKSEETSRKSQSTTFSITGVSVF